VKNTPFLTGPPLSWVRRPLSIWKLLLCLFELEVSRTDLLVGVLHVPGGDGREPPDQGQQAGGVHSVAEVLDEPYSQLTRSAD
jgi:hypothetical protein